MRATLPILAALVLVPALAAAATPGLDAHEEELVATCHIHAGSPTTLFRSTNVLQLQLLGEVLVDGIDSCFFTPPAPGTWIRVRANEHHGVPYSLDVYFRQADGTFLGDNGCATLEPDAECEVPAGAALANADALYGVDLTVGIYALR